MRTNIILVDFENVQPKDIGLLRGGPFMVKVFLGPNQSKVPVTLAVFTLLLATVSYEWFEKHFLKLKEKFARIPSRPI
jgi:hypothetical protein